MNAGINNAAVATWKRIKMQHVTTVCGLALAVGAAVAVGGWQPDRPLRPAETAEVPASTANFSADEPARIVFFIVSSQFQADALRWQFESDNAGLRGSWSDPFVRILLGDTTENESAAYQSVADIMDSGPLVQVVDMRQR